MKTTIPINFPINLILCGRHIWIFFFFMFSCLKSREVCARRHFNLLRKQIWISVCVWLGLKLGIEMIVDFSKSTLFVQAKWRAALVAALSCIWNTWRRCTYVRGLCVLPAVIKLPIIVMCLWRKYEMRIFDTFGSCISLHLQTTLRAAAHNSNYIQYTGVHNIPLHHYLWTEYIMYLIPALSSSPSSRTNTCV